MTEIEALEKAKKYLAFCTYMSECGSNAGLRKIYDNQIDWLSWITYLAEKQLKLNSERIDII